MPPSSSAIPVYTTPAGLSGCVLAIGNFDGVHLGHRHLIAEAARIARESGAPLAVLTFEPHPREFFQPQGAPFRLTLAPLKARLLQELGVAHLYALPFDAALAACSAADFIDGILIRGIGAAHVVVGEDFAFGHKRSGTVAQLRAAKAFGVTAVAAACDGGGAVYSSSRIRDFLRAGDLEAAARLLGWRWRIGAEVIHGDKRGRTIGFPTANQEVGRHLHLPFGIYAVRARIEGEETWRPGVANLGIRPMYRLETPLLETYLFDYDGDLYGKYMETQPVAFLRGEQYFEGLEALMAQIKQDCLAARVVLKSA